MNTPCQKLRRGMTLIELLVVIAIIGLLAVAVLPNLSNTRESREGRDAANVVTSFIAKAQARALGRNEWAGFTIVPSSTNSYGAGDLVVCDVPPLYRGDTVPARVSITGAGSATRSASWTNGELQFASARGVSVGDLVQFDDRANWYEVSSVPADTVSGSFNFKLRGASSGASEDAGYQPHNTAWPPAAGSSTFAILRQPVPGGAPLTLPSSRVIDLYWSGFGPATLASGTNPYQLFETGTTGIATRGATTSILMDGSGRVRQIQVKVSGGSPTRLTATGPIFLLIGRSDRVPVTPQDPYDVNLPNNIKAADSSTGANWQYLDSYWVAIDPSTGSAKFAQCTPTPTPAPLGKTVKDRIVDSQLWIRQTLLPGGG